MTLVMRCDEKDRLVGYLYGEGSAVERTAVEAHLARCALCAAELDDLKAVRVHLAAWSPPEADLGFGLTRAPLVAPSAHRRWTIPAWAQAAAAVLVLAAGAGLSNLQIQYGPGGLTIRTGWGIAAPGPQPSAVRQGASMPITAADLSALEQRLRAELTANPHGAPPAAPAAVLAANPRDVLPQVRALLDESERRRQKELAMRLADVVRDFEVQRRADLVHIEQNMRQLEGVTGEQAAGQREMMNYLLRVSERR